MTQILTYALVLLALGTARRQGVAVVLVEPDVHWATGFSDDCVVLEDGRLAWKGSAGASGRQALRDYRESMTAAP